MAGVISAADLGGVADPRLGREADLIGTSRQNSVAAARGQHPLAASAGLGRTKDDMYVDSGITFEDYHYWANISREEERHFVTSNTGLQGLWKSVTGYKKRAAVADDTKWTVGVDAADADRKVLPDHGSAASSNEKTGAEKEKDLAGEPSDPKNLEDNYGITGSEWDRAQRALRNASWGSIFYLITTDILGPYNVPWAISRMGYGPGFALYTVFGGMVRFSCTASVRRFC